MSKLKCTVLLVAIWVAFGWPAYHLHLGAFTHEFPSQCHSVASMFFAGFGPGAIVQVPISASIAGVHWQWVPISKEQRWEAFDAEWPLLGKDYFDKDNSGAACWVDSVIRRAHGLEP